MAEYKFRTEYERGVTGYSPAGVTMETQIPFATLTREEVRRLLEEGREVAEAVKKMAEPMFDITWEDETDLY